MSMVRNAKLALGIALVTTLAGCLGSNKEAPLVSLKTLPSLFTKQEPVIPTVTPEQIGQVLAATGKPVSVYVLENTKAQFILVEVERNQGYQTYGSRARQTVAQRNGMMVSTRGFGGDLMSSDEGALLSLVRNRSVGTASYVMRFLTSDNQTRVLAFECKLDVGDTHAVALGEVNSKGVAVTANCSGDGGSFNNLYVVDARGNILSGRQWLGDVIGYMNVQALRQ